MLKNKAARKHLEVVPEPSRTELNPEVPHAKEGTRKRALTETKRERKLRIVPLDEEDRGEDFIDGALSHRVYPDE